VAPRFTLVPSHRYTHRPLRAQLEELGVRALELDVHLEDAKSGTLAVYHIAGIDSNSRCRRFDACLAEIRDWSRTHPCHLPVTVWIEAKDGTGGDDLDDPSVIDRAVLRVLDESDLLRPDDVRRDHASVRAALEAEGWPPLARARGRLMLVLLDRGDKTRVYTHGSAHLRGRLMFAQAEPSQFREPWAAFAKIDEPDARAAIEAAHAHHILVGSNVCAAGRSDAECRARLRRGLAHGVHMLKDDYPGPTEGRTYRLALPGGTPGRCNPVTAPEHCIPGMLVEAPTAAAR
jgi:hypothetical protein